MEHDIIATLIDIESTEKSQVDLIKVYNKEQVLKSICAFLNLDGGWIIIGCDKKRIFHPIPNKQTMVELQKSIEEEISPLPLIDFRSERYLGNEVILINVIKGYRTPYVYKNKFYIRAANKTQLAGADDISILLRKSREFVSTWENLTALEASLDDLNIGEINSTIEKANILMKKIYQNDISYKNFLKYFQLYDGHSIKNGSVILFGRNPSNFFPQCSIRITVMEKDKTGNEYKVRFFRDNLFETFLKVQDYFKQNNVIISRFSDDNWERKDRHQYPFEALDEAIVNAMVHRDYGDFGGEVTINIYPNKIEIINSGEIPANVISGKNKILSHNSILRNPIIAHMFFLRGYMEKIGRGLNFIKESFVNKGFKAPEWKSLHGYTTLTLFGDHELIIVNERMVSFLKNLQTSSFTRDDYHLFFKSKSEEISERTARMDIDKLIIDGWIKKVGSGPSTKYNRTNKILPDSAG